MQHTFSDFEPKKSQMKHVVHSKIIWILLICITWRISRLWFLPVHVHVEFWFIAYDDTKEKAVFEKPQMN